MPSNQDRRELSAAMTGVVLEASLAPWGGRRVCTDAYEMTIQATADLQLTVANVVRLEPIRSFVVACSNATRDVGATQLSTARWFLDV
jgi:hypothetical protein